MPTARAKSTSATFVARLTCVVAMLGATPALAGGSSNGDAVGGEAGPQRALGLKIKPLVKGGFAGTFDSENRDREMEVSWLLGGEVDYALADYFSVGGRLEAGSIGIGGSEDRSRDRHALVNLDGVAKVRGAVGERIELYGSVPIGVSKLFLSDDRTGGVSFNVMLAAGMEIDLSDRLGIFWELGWWNQALTFVNQGNDTNQTGRFQQFIGSVGLVFEP